MRFEFRLVYDAKDTLELTGIGAFACHSVSWPNSADAGVVVIVGGLTILDLNRKYSLIHSIHTIPTL